MDLIHEPSVDVVGEPSIHSGIKLSPHLFWNLPFILVKDGSVLLIEGVI